MKVFDLVIENTKTKYVFNAEQYGNSVKEIKDYWKSRENDDRLNGYRLISCKESKRK